MLQLCEKPPWWKLDPEDSANQDEMLGFHCVGKELKAREVVAKFAPELLPVAEESVDLKPGQETTGEMVSSKETVGREGRLDAKAAQPRPQPLGGDVVPKFCPGGDAGVDGQLLAPSTDPEKNSRDGGPCVTVWSHLCGVQCHVQPQGEVGVGEAGGKEAESRRAKERIHLGTTPESDQAEEGNREEAGDGEGGR